MNFNLWRSDRSTDAKTRELEIQKSCNQRRIAEIDRDSVALTETSHLRPEQGTIVPYRNPRSGKQEFFLIEASHAAEFMRLQEEKDCLQKRVEELERELSNPTPLEMPAKPDSKGTDRSPQPWRTLPNPPTDLPDSPLRYDASHLATAAVEHQTAETGETPASSGWGTFLALLTAIGLTILLL
jgi:hypothetical protein